MTLKVLVVDIYEPEGAGWDYPILQHRFIGRTKAEASGYLESHMKTDEFLRGCSTKSRWHDVSCLVETYWEEM